MIGKIPTWWENSVRGNRKTVGKIPPWWEIPSVGEKSLPLHGSFSTAAPVLYAGIHLPLFSQCGVKGGYDSYTPLTHFNPTLKLAFTPVQNL
jgi:hypothetical protein